MSGRLLHSAHLRANLLGCMSTRFELMISFFFQGWRPLVEKQVFL